MNYVKKTGCHLVKENREDSFNMKNQNEFNKLILLVLFSATPSFIALWKLVSFFVANFGDRSVMISPIYGIVIGLFFFMIYTLGISTTELGGVYVLQQFEKSEEVEEPVLEYMEERFESGEVDKNEMMKGIFLLTGLIVITGLEYFWTQQVVYLLAFLCEIFQVGMLIYFMTIGEKAIKKVINNYYEAIHKEDNKIRNSY